MLCSDTLSLHNVNMRTFDQFAQKFSFVFTLNSLQELYENEKFVKDRYTQIEQSICNHDFFTKKYFAQNLIISMPKACQVMAIQRAQNRQSSQRRLSMIRCFLWLVYIKSL